MKNVVIQSINNTKNKLIKLLGGYTSNEYQTLDKKRIRAEQKYQALLDSKTTDNYIIIANEYIGRVLMELRRYAKRVLYPLCINNPFGGNEWANRMYNVIENNLIRLTIRYQKSDSSLPYIIDTTLDSKDEFINIIKNEGSYDEVEYIIDNIIDND